MLERHAKVTWFTPSRIASTAGTTAVSDDALTPKQQHCGQQHADQAAALAQPCNNSPSSIAPNHNNNNSNSGNNSNSNNNINNANNKTDPLSVYGPAFEKKPSAILRGRRLRPSRSTLVFGQTLLSPTSLSATARSRHHKQTHAAYPNDSTFVTPRRLSQDSSSGYSITGSLLSENDDVDDDELMEAAAFPQSWSDMYYAEMPLELLDNIFQQLLYVSSDSLSGLAEEKKRVKSRTYTAPVYFSRPHTLPPQVLAAGVDLDQFVRQQDELKLWLQQEDPQQYQLLYDQWVRGGCYDSPALFQTLKPFELSRASSASDSTSSSRSASRPPTSRLDSNLLTDHELSYDAEDDNESEEMDSDGGFEANQKKSRNTVSTLGHMMSNLDMDNSRHSSRWIIEEDYGDDEGSTSSGSHEIGYAYRDDSLSGTTASMGSSSASYTDEDDYEGDLEDVESVNGASSVTDTQHSMSDASAPKAMMSSSSSVSSGGGSNAKTFRRAVRARASSQCCCNLGFQDSYVQSISSRRGINRVNDDLDEEKVLYQLHRDQYFHPTTHTSLQSDLYNCSLVNRQWRIAALQLLWQNVVLDSESCRPEPTDPCASCRYPKAYRHGSFSTTSPPSSSTSSSPSRALPRASTSPSTFSSSRITRTRLEAMLDSYLEIYGLDLAKCVQTVELDLRLLVWSAEGESVKRILKRLSPFTHLRLVWAGNESQEEIITGFRVAMETMYLQIRHVHFFDGFVISKAWAREMERMERLETVTMETLGGMEMIEYNWRQIKFLQLNYVIPRSALGYPEGSPSPPVTMPLITGGSHTAAQQHSDEAISVAAAAMTPSFGLQGLGVGVPGWGQWTGLRKIQIRIRDHNEVLQREWLQDLTNVITQNSILIDHHCQQRFQGAAISTATSPSLFGPPLEVLDIDCEVSHPHKEIFTNLVQAWGHRLEEFHFSQSAELTDDFFWLCLQKMTRIKKLSLRDSRGITGEGISLEPSCNDGAMGASTAVAAVAATAVSKGIKVPIMWPREFRELNLDQSRVRGDFLRTLQAQCPGMRFKVREMRQ
ncbi:hypothetical protein EDD21DRAFT_156637 [Dissophora ornata]|nr:hypothetical protein EDD21DRAFT_156637 [Dissophora ornata]